MSFHSSSDNSKVNELYCSSIGQLDVTGWSSYTNLTTVYINANEDDIEIIGTIPQNVICYYREGTNSEYFLTENIIVKALSSLLKLKADKSDTYTQTEVDTAIQTAIGTIETQLSQV